MPIGDPPRDPRNSSAAEPNAASIRRHQRQGVADDATPSHAPRAPAPTSPAARAIRSGGRSSMSMSPIAGSSPPDSDLRATEQSPHQDGCAPRRWEPTRVTAARGRVDAERGARIPETARAREMSIERASAIRLISDEAAPHQRRHHTSRRPSVPLRAGSDLSTAAGAFATATWGGTVGTVRAATAKSQVASQRERRRRWGRP